MSKELELVERIVKGIETTGYTTIDESGEKRTLKIEDVKKLCKNNMITNAEVVLDAEESEYTLYTTEDIPKKEENKKYIVSCRVVDNKKCIAYIVKDKTGKSYKVDINKLWELSRDGLVWHLEGKIVNGSKALISDDKLDLLKIKVMKYENN